MKGASCIAFYKYDGSNLRFEWSKKRGWWKFGTRHQLFDRSHPDYGGAIDIFLKKYGDALASIFLKQKGLQQAIVFCEFYGQLTFAGHHIKTDPKDVILFDVVLHRDGVMGPRRFLDTFGHLDIAKVVYEGPMDGDFIQRVRDNKLDSPLMEGVICKGGDKHRIWMTKIKTLAYLAKLKEVFTSKWEQYGE